MPKISINLTDEQYARITSAQTECGIKSPNEFIVSLINIMFEAKFDSINADDLSWVKYVYPLGMFANSVKQNFIKSQPENTDVINYLSVMTLGIKNFVDSIVIAEDFKLDQQQELLFVDAVNSFCMWLDKNDLTEYKVRKLNEKLKQNLRDNV